MIISNGNEWVCVCVCILDGTHYPQWSTHFGLICKYLETKHVEIVTAINKFIFV